MPASLAARLVADELMDDPALDVVTYHEVLADLAQVNQLTFAYRPTMAFLRSAARGRKRLSVLDVGFGDGDMLRRIARWAARHDLDAELTGVDLNPRSKAAAEAKRSALPIRYFSGDYAGLAGEGFDCVISSLVTHHMTSDQLVAFLRFMEREAAVGWFVNDLHRHRLAYEVWPLLASAMSWHRIVRLDGHTSIARSFRPDEWRALLAREGLEQARVRRWFPFRLCVDRFR
jgi:2-polyprenyl-3-methyl-5-hydroxy-6-metoxy-1,4-benzoquinol methylase